IASLGLSIVVKASSVLPIGGLSPTCLTVSEFSSQLLMFSTITRRTSDTPDVSRGVVPEASALNTSSGLINALLLAGRVPALLSGKTTGFMRVGGEKSLATNEKNGRQTAKRPPVTKSMEDFVAAGEL